VLQLDSSAYYQICETNQYTEHESCASHHPLYVAFWYVGYVINPTSVTALATVAIAWFTWTLKESTDRLWRSGNDQFVLATNEFNSTHRPKMRLKHAWFTDPTAWRLGGPLEINLDFVNIGDSDAFISWVNYQSLLLLKGERLPQRPPYDEIPPSGVRTTRFPTNARVRSGLTLPRTVCDGILNDREVHDILWGERVLYLIGTIEYWDSEFRFLRQTAFCRRLVYKDNPPADLGDAGRFVVIRDPDYEYED
jgi:hypothetical protein